MFYLVMLCDQFNTVCILLVAYDRHLDIDNIMPNVIIDHGMIELSHLITINVKVTHLKIWNAYRFNITTTLLEKDFVFKCYE